MQTQMGQTRLWVDGVGSPIVSQVTRTRGARCTIEQALPFLRLDTGVHDEAQRRGRIERVGLAYDGDTPRLVVDLVYEDEAADEPTAGATAAEVPAADDAATRYALDDTVPAVPVLGATTGKPRDDETVPFAIEEPRQTREIVVSDVPPPPAVQAAPVGAIAARLVGWIVRFGQAAERVAAQVTERLRPALA